MHQIGFHYFHGWGWVGGWVAGSIKNKAISASNKVEVEAELGNMKKNLNKLGLSCAKLKPAYTSYPLVFG